MNAARDDYPAIPLTADSNEYRTVSMDIDDYVAALDEIDRLRNALIDHMVEFHPPVGVSGWDPKDPQPQHNKEEA